MIFTFWLFVITLLGFGITLLVGKWWLIMLGYLAVGAMWVMHDSSRPVFFQPIGYMTWRGTLYLWLLWPNVAAHAAKERWDALHSPTRFEFCLGVGLEERQTFASLQNAIAAAQRRATELNECVLVFDWARFYWDLMQQNWANLYYIVDPSGAVERADLAQLRD